jgi:hypothetical protein
MERGGAVKGLAICGICGIWFDERTYQVVVPVLHASFDKVECAELALHRHLREASRPALDEALADEVERLREQLPEGPRRVSQRDPTTQHDRG